MSCVPGDLATELLVATRSADKMAEIRAILGVVPHLRVLDLDEAGLAHSPAEEDLGKL